MASVDTEGALRSRLEVVLGAVSDGVIATDGTGVVTSANPEALRLLAASIGDVVGRPLRAVVRLRRTDGTPLRVRPGSSTDAWLAVARRQVPVRVSSVPLPGTDGAVVTLTDRSRDSEIDRLKTEFLANVSHELRTPLTPIKGYAEMLARRPGIGESQVRVFAEEILVATERMDRIVALLVDVAALDAGRVRPAVCSLPVGTLLAPALESWRARWPDRAADVRQGIAAGLPDVDVDPDWIRKALTELVDNAVKLTEPGDAVVIRADLVPGRRRRVRVTVCDAGPGLEPERVAELLGDFSQADASETRRFSGLGLGLGFVRRVAERFGIGLSVAVTDRGSEFGLDLPEARPRVASSSRRAGADDRFLPSRGDA